MIKRIIYSITKHKILNTLLVVFMILSFVGITFSSYYMMKTTKFLGEFDDSRNSIIYTDYPVFDEESYDWDEAFEPDSNIFFDLYKKANENEKLDATLNLNVFNLQFKETVSDKMYNGYSDEYSYTYLDITTSRKYLDLEYDLPKDLDTTKIHISEVMAIDRGLQVGDKLTLGYIDYDNMYQNMTYEEPSTEDYLVEMIEVEIGSIFKVRDLSELGIGDDEEYEGEEGFEGEYEGEMVDTVSHTVYIPIEIIIDTDNQNIETYGGELIVSGEKEAVKDFFYDSNNNSNSISMYLTDDIINSELEFFQTMNNFFIIILILSIAIFIVSFSSLNNNILEKRKEELQLYSVFGIKMKNIRTQLIVERVTLYAMSLIIAIPLILYTLRIATNIINTLVEYTLYESYNLYNLLTMLGKFEEITLIDSGISAVSVSLLLVILISIVVMLVIIIVVTIISFAINKKNILNQRRGE